MKLDVIRVIRTVLETAISKYLMTTLLRMMARYRKEKIRRVGRPFGRKESSKEPKMS